MPYYCFRILQWYTITYATCFCIDPNALKGDIFRFSYVCTFFNIASSAAPHIPPCRRMRDRRTQDSCDFGIGCQTLWPLGYISSKKDTDTVLLTLIQYLNSLKTALLRSWNQHFLLMQVPVYNGHFIACFLGAAYKHCLLLCNVHCHYCNLTAPAWPNNEDKSHE